MTEELNKDATELKKVIGRYNFIIVGLFSVSLLPAITFYLDGNGEWKWFLIILLISLTFFRIPNSVIDKIQFSKRTIIYRKLRVHLFKKYATNGDIINKKIRQQFPKHRNVHNPLSIQRKIIETYTTERTHFFFFIFCFLTSIYAWSTNHFVHGTAITVGNIVFNLYPILLQQYNRIRYKDVLASRRVNGCGLVEAESKK